jgi:Glycosidases
VLLLTLPGTAFVYQGDELGLANGPGHEPPFDRAGRDRLRHPMQWQADGGFTSGTPWLPLVDPKARNVADEQADPGSLLNLYRSLIEVRRGIGPGFRPLDAHPGVVAFERDGHTVAVNTPPSRAQPPRASPCSRPTRAKASLRTLR